MAFVQQGISAAAATGQTSSANRTVRLAENFNDHSRGVLSVGGCWLRILAALRGASQLADNRLVASKDL